MSTESGAIQFTARQWTEARGVVNPRLQGLPAPSFSSPSKRELGREFAGGDATIDAGAAQGGDADHVAEAVEGRLGILRISRGVFGMWHGCTFLGVPKSLGCSTVAGRETRRGEPWCRASRELSPLRRDCGRYKAEAIDLLPPFDFSRSGLQQRMLSFVTTNSGVRKLVPCGRSSRPTPLLKAGCRVRARCRSSRPNYRRQVCSAMSPFAAAPQAHHPGPKDSRNDLWTHICIPLSKGQTQASFGN